MDNINIINSIYNLLIELNHAIPYNCKDELSSICNDIDNLFYSIGMNPHMTILSDSKSTIGILRRNYIKLRAQARHINGNDGLAKAAF